MARGCGHNNHLSDIFLRGGDGEDDDDHGAPGSNFISLPSFFYTEIEDDIYNGIWDFISIFLVFPMMKKMTTIASGVLFFISAGPPSIVETETTFGGLDYYH